MSSPKRPSETRCLRQVGLAPRLPRHPELQAQGIRPSKGSRNRERGSPMAPTGPVTLGKTASRGAGSPDTSPTQRALVTSSVFTENQMAAKLGRVAYSYRSVYRAFEPLLRPWGPTVEITRPESRLPY